MRLVATDDKMPRMRPSRALVALILPVLLAACGVGSSSGLSKAEVDQCNGALGVIRDNGSSIVALNSSNASDRVTATTAVQGAEAKLAGYYKAAPAGAVKDALQGVGVALVSLTQGSLAKGDTSDQYDKTFLPAVQTLRDVCGVKG